MELFERLLSSIDKVDGHWLWNKALTWNGYGILNVAGKLQRAHIMSYQEFVGPIPTGLCVLHSNECIKHRNCINPAHLYLGNRGDNSKDCFSTGGRRRSHLSDNDITDIRLDAREYITIASDYNITAQAVSQIKHRRTWKQVAPNIPGVISTMARR